MNTSCTSTGHNGIFSSATNKSDTGNSFSSTSIHLLTKRSQSDNVSDTYATSDTYSTKSGISDTATPMPTDVKKISSTLSSNSFSSSNKFAQSRSTQAEKSA